jgi:integrase
MAVTTGAIYQNPAKSIKKSQVKYKRTELPSKENFHRIVNAIASSGAPQGQDCADLVSLLAFTGCRVGEAQLLTWKNINWDKKRIEISGTKTVSSERVIPMIPPLENFLSILRERRKEETKKSPILRVKKCQRAINTACEELGLGRITHHSLRHLFATICIESGVDIPTVSRWLGHKDGGALAMRTYGHLRDEHSTEAALKVTFDAPNKRDEKVISFKNAQV